MSATSSSLLNTLKQGIADIDRAGLRRRRRIIDSACAAHMTVDGREIIGFASNDYLGLAAHETLREALAEGARLYGAGSGGSHLLGGHSRAHAKRARCISAPATWRISRH
jgi:8-amino-7-oxononanoate synthase